MNKGITSSSCLTYATTPISAGTIDDTVDERLRDKVTALSTLMKDPALVRLALPDPDEVSSEDRNIWAEDDLQLVLSHVNNAS
ncbi:hypothetical protein [Burkholderia ubonensis]|nr:hypothetical protein [Burkholderia ubonensis]